MRAPEFDLSGSELAPTLLGKLRMIEALPSKAMTRACSWLYSSGS